ncbi:MAG: alpha/beta fold hydrolase [Chloroflexota bacterium]
MEIFELGDFPLSTGHTLPGAQLSYKTQGTLNAAKDNAILFPHFLGGAPEALEGWIGQGRALDPTDYFIIMPGQFGNGVSTSPSNAQAPFERGAFPAVLHADDVRAQHRLITEKFGIEQLQLVLGWSTGALQTYEWAVNFPDVVKRAASIAGAPRPSPWTRLWLRTCIEEPLVSDPAWNSGFYTDARALQGGLRRQAHATAMTLPPQGFYREGHERWRCLGFSSRDDFISRFWEAFWLPQDPGNLVLQSRKAQAADPARGGDLGEALSKITARMLVLAFTGDPMFPPDECAFDAQRIRQSNFREVQSDFGHLATFGLAQQDVQAVDGALRDLLNA